MTDKAKIDLSKERSLNSCRNTCKIFEGYKDDMQILYDLIIEEQKIIRSNKAYTNASNDYNLLSEKGQFVIDFIDLTFRLEKLIKDIELVELLIPKYFEVQIKIINEIDYINYHLEVFFHKINTILDVFKLLVNHVYKLGLKEEDCDWKKIKQLKNKISPDAFDILEKYHKSFKSIIQMRNLNTHRNISVNPNGNIISGLLMMRDLKGKQLDPLFPKYVNEKVQSHMINRVEYVHKSKDIAKFYMDFINVALLEDVLISMEIKK